MIGGSREIVEQGGIREGVIEAVEDLRERVLRRRENEVSGEKERCNQKRKTCSMVDGGKVERKAEVERDSDEEEDEWFDTQSQWSSS